ncbi:MAG: helix-turn-helix domain-containing protein, partial [Haloarculaceae archaeon]
ELVSTCRSAGLLGFDEFACYGNGAVIQVEVAEPLDSSRLRGIEYVDRVEHLTRTDESELYLIAFTSPALSDEITSHADDLVGTCDPDVSGDGVTMSFVGPQDAIRGTVGEYQTAGLSPDLQQLGEYSGNDRPLASPTARQREVIRTAFEMGYYEVPRPVSTRDVADELDLDPSTVAEHLQRAERNLLTQHLAPEN